MQICLCIYVPNKDSATATGRVRCPCGARGHSHLGYCEPWHGKNTLPQRVWRVGQADGSLLRASAWCSVQTQDDPAPAQGNLRVCARPCLQLDRRFSLAALRRAHREGKGAFPRSSATMRRIVCARAPKNSEAFLGLLGQKAISTLPPAHREYTSAGRRAVQVHARVTSAPRRRRPLLPPMWRQVCSATATVSWRSRAQAAEAERQRRRAALPKVGADQSIKRPWRDNGSLKLDMGTHGS